MYFSANAFLPDYLHHRRARRIWCSAALTALNLGQIPASLLLLGLAGRLVRRPAAYGGGGVLLLAGVLGCVAMPGPAAVAWAGLAGFACAMLLTLALALPSPLGAAEDVPRLAAGGFTVSYSVSVAAALLAGWLWDSERRRGDGIPAVRAGGAGGDAVGGHAAVAAGACARALRHVLVNY